MKNLLVFFLLTAFISPFAIAQGALPKVTFGVSREQREEENQRREQAQTQRLEQRQAEMSAKSSKENAKTLALVALIGGSGFFFFRRVRQAKGDQTQNLIGLGITGAVSFLISQSVRFMSYSEADYGNGMYMPLESESELLPNLFLITGIVFVGIAGLLFLKQNQKNS